MNVSLYPYQNQEGNSRFVVAPGWKDSPLKIAVHNREEHLEEKVDGVDQHRQQVEPCFARHHGDGGFDLRQKDSMARSTEYEYSARQDVKL